MLATLFTSGNVLNCGQRDGRDRITTMCEVATGNCFTIAGKCIPLLKECKIMDYVEGRGVCCGNEVYFDYVDGKVVMTMYRDMPGVRSDRLKPNVIKTFVPAQWGEINEYLMGTLDRVEGVFNDDEEEAEEAESSPLFQQIVPETSDEEKEEGDEELADVTEREEKEEDGKEDE